MPMQVTPTGYDITYSRAQCVAFALGALPFATLMLLAGISSFVPLLQQTSLHWLQIERNPQQLYSAIAIMGSLLFGYLVITNALRATINNLSIQINSSGVESRTIIGVRSIQWPDVSSVTSHRSTIFLHPTKDSRSPTVPLNLHLTSVTADELRALLPRYRPDLFHDQ